MIKVDDIVRSKKQGNVVIPYLVKEINETEAKCINLIDACNYTIPLEDLYIWIVR